MSPPAESPTLTGLLGNVVIQNLVLEELDLRSRVRLAATSPAVRELVYSSPACFRHIEIPRNRSVQILDYCFSLQPTISLHPACHIAPFPPEPYGASLRFVTVLILDYASFDVDSLNQLLTSDHYAVQILSVVTPGRFRTRAFKALYQVLNRCPKPFRSLKGVYAFGTQSPSVRDDGGALPTMAGVTATLGAVLGQQQEPHHLTTVKVKPARTMQQDWYRRSGIVIPDEIAELPEEGAQLLKMPLHFDAVACRGPLHRNDKDKYAPVATIALAGCETCHSMPEGGIDPADAPHRSLPLLRPAPDRPSIRSAQLPLRDPKTQKWPHFFARCNACLRGRWCYGCGRFWCEKCYQIPSTSASTSQSHSLDNPPNDVKIFSGVCVQHCLRDEELLGSGSGGMWG